MAQFDDILLRRQNARRSTAMLPPHAPVTLEREDFTDLLAAITAVGDQVRGRESAQ